MYREADSLKVLHAEINAAAPHRSTASDGWIADAAHASRESDHNPWVKDSRGIGVVRARDFTNDPMGGLDCKILADKLAAKIRRGDHPALGSGAYVIWNRRIISHDRIAEGWRPYSGTNPHTKHLHLSVATAQAGYDSDLPWNIVAPVKKRRPKSIRLAIKAGLEALADPTTGPTRRKRIEAALREYRKVRKS
jgi:hypothetical protein